MVKYEEIKDQFDIWLVNGDNSIQNVFLEGASVSVVNQELNPEKRLLRIQDTVGRCFVVVEDRWFWSWEDANRSLKIQGGAWEGPVTKQQK